MTIRIENRFGFFTDSDFKTHAVHTTPTPRVGGLGVFIAFAITVLYVLPEYWWLVAGGAVVFGFGLFEDWHGDTKKEYRLGAMALGTLMAVYFGGYVADNSEFFILPYWIAVFFTIFAVVGLSSAINFIDGLNGLASGISIITLLFFALLSYLYDDNALLGLSLIGIAATLGFFLWNYPHGKIFLGDGGAYFLGFLLAILSIMLSERHAEIPLWYPLAALSYPIIETFVTIERRIKRRKKKGVPFFEAEKVHLHTLKFRRKVRKNYGATNSLLLFHILINMLAFSCYQNVYALMLVIVFAYAVYIFKYRRIILFGRRTIKRCISCFYKSFF
ncbi:MraY family glycosyltransferase [Sulfurimonas sp. HSL-1656]|uniref:MraY family glycosyltransferase n=1 Tax=Thiomicrolovo subterrani TaxID=3131934 RepID=UPI0031F849F1